MSFILRDYQKEAISSIKRAYADGINKQVIVLATGTGKTVIFCNVIKDFVIATKKKALVLAHREELLTQARDKILKVEPSLKVCIEQGQNWAGEDCDVVVASVPTIGRANSPRIKRFNPSDFSIIVVDEAHHASAETYKNIFRYFGVLKKTKPRELTETDKKYMEQMEFSLEDFYKDIGYNPELDNVETAWNEDCLLLGVTATPSRGDNKGIDTVFDDVIYKYDIIKAIQAGSLTRVKAFRVNTSTDLSNVKKTAGDFNLGELGDAVNNEERNKLIVRTYKDKFNGKRALCFCVDVQHTKDLHTMFNEEGVPTGFVTGDTATELRREMLARFYSDADNRLDVMCNAMVLTEGYDNEKIEVVLMARPTASGILFQQMVGRGTRLFPGKECLTIVDFVDNTYKQNLKTSASLIGVPGNIDFKGQDILFAKSEIDELLELAPNTDLEKIDINKIKYAIEEVDLLSGLEIPDEISIYTSYDWHRYSEDEYRVGLPEKQQIVVRQNITGQYELSDEKWDTDKNEVKVIKVREYDTLESAIKGGDLYVTESYPEVITLISEDSRWRKQPPSEAQLQLLKKFGVNDIVLASINKGKASRLITKMINRKTRTNRSAW
jgi:ATP-dependent helicase IRC3